VTLLFSQMMGALVLHAAGRLKGRGVGPRELVRLQLGLLRQAGVSVVDTQDRRRRHDDET
jgi:hypothetical protein